MTFEYDDAQATEGVKAAMSAADKKNDYDIERSSALAAHAMKKLGIPIKQAESHWEKDLDTSALILCLSNKEQTKMITISIQAFQHTETPDEVSLQVVNAKDPLDEVTTLGAEYRGAITRNTNRVVSETVKTVTVYNKQYRGSVQRCIHRLDGFSEARWGTTDFTYKYKRSHGLSQTMTEIRFAPSMASANYNLVFANFNNTTSDEKALINSPDSFAALTAIAGDVSEFKSIPTELLN